MLHLQRASAGSGKTYTLAKQFIWFLIAVKTGENWRLRTDREISDGLSRILAITFTNKATNEMKQRIVEKLADLSVAAEPGAVTPHLLKTTAYLQEFSTRLGVAPELIGQAAKEALSVVLNDYSDFRVSTIDSFFQSVLRTFAYESNLNDSYQVEIDSDFLAMAAIDATLDEVNRPGLPDTPSGRWLKILMREASDAGNNWNVFQKSGKTESIYSQLRRTLTKIESEEFKEIRTKLDEWFADVTEGNTLEDIYLNLKAAMEKPLKESMAKAKAAASTLKSELRKRGLDPVESCPKNFSGHLKKLRSLSYDYSGNESKYIFKPLNLTGKKILKKGVSHPDADFLTALAEDMYDAYGNWLALRESKEWRHWKVYSPNIPYLGLLGEARMKMNEFLDSNNLIQLGETNSMLQRIIGEDDAPFIYERLGSVINHYLIDEFQDTSRMQWDNLNPLLKESDSRGEDNLIIGDAKQSIYRFRNADPSLITTTVPTLFPRHHAAGMSREDNTNWRSERRIVEFNNLFFHALAQRIDGMRLGDLDFADLYANVAQYPHRREDKGYVEIRFIKGELSEESKNAGMTQTDADTALAVDSVGPLISSLIERGVRQKDVAILVDRNDDGKAVIASLVAYNASLPTGQRRIDFISEDSLLVSQAESVGIIVGVLRNLVDGRGSDFDFYSMRNQDKAPAEQVAGFLKEKSPRDAIDTMLADMQSVALPALVEAITEKFVPLEFRKTQAVFIAAFQDMVIDYTERYPTDTASFLNWWDSKGVYRSISSPEGTDAVQIMTVHKAKGLEFKCVIIPLATSSFETDRKSEWRWVKPASFLKDAGLPPFLPVSTTRALLDTEHADKYVEYHDLYMMDKLNSAYVAFTRAVDELYIFTRDTKTKSSLGFMLRDILTPAEDDLFSATENNDLLLPQEEIIWNDDETVVTVGTPPESYAAEEKKSSKDGGPEERCIDEYGVDSSPAILHYVETEGDDSTTLDPLADDDPRSEGNLLHAVMERVDNASDLHNAVLTLRMRGLISNEQAHDWEEWLKEAISAPEVAPWFDGSRRVVNERDILLRGNKNRRPDRIMLDDSRRNAVIVDYKFGTIPDNDEHILQVREYMRLLREALRLRSVEGYVWYVREGKVVNVGNQGL